MSDEPRTITVRLHTEDEKPNKLTYAYLKTDIGWDIANWSPARGGWLTSCNWPVKDDEIEYWISLAELAEAVEAEEDARFAAALAWAGANFSTDLSDLEEV